MWISKREWARHQRELRAALDRATRAEDQLASERQSKDWMITQLTSRFVTKQGGYGLDHEVPRKPEAHSQTPAREITAQDEARLEYYKRCYAEAGKPEEDAVALWQAEMRGETVTYEYEKEQ